MRLILFALILILPFCVGRVWAGDTPGTYTNYAWPEGTRLEKVEFSLTPIVDPGRLSNIFWSNEFNFTDGQVAYTGMQSNGGQPRQFMFSVWDATEMRLGSPGSDCHPFDGEGVGRNCKMLHEWKAGQEFVFVVAHEGDRWFGATVVDVKTGESFKLGSIRAKSSRISGDGMSTWTEYFEWNNDASSCFNQPYSQVRVKWPRGDGGAVVAGLDFNDQSKGCSSMSRVDVVHGGVLQSNAIGNSIRGEVTIASGECLDAYGGAESGTNAITYACNGQDNQAWIYASNGSLQLQQGLCLDVVNAGKKPGAAVIISDCDKADDQRWLYADGQLKAHGSGLCLTAHDGDQLTIETCAGDAGGQRWRLPMAPANH
ncbi:MAG TPA: ricin-type beta-trefoil lectin domain protein [Pseudoxanthomonas sp.]